MASDDQEIVLAVKNGSPVAFSQLVVRYQKRVYALAYRMLGNHAEADDVGQETFLRAYRSIHRFEGNAEFYTWLCRIALNVCYDHLRSRKPIVSLDDEAVLALENSSNQQKDPIRRIEARLSLQKLQQAMFALPSGIRAALILIVFEGLTAKKASQVLGCSEGTVSWRVHEGRKRLIEAMGEFEEFSKSKKTQTPPRKTKVLKSDQGAV